MTTEYDADMLEYFWTEKRDVTRWCGYEDWARRNPEQARGLGQLLADRRAANIQITRYIQSLGAKGGD